MRCWCKNLKLRRALILVFRVLRTLLRSVFMAGSVIVLGSLIYRALNFSFCDVRSQFYSKAFKKNIVVDATLLMGKGGISSLTKCVLQEMARARADWNFLILTSQASTDLFDDLASKNIKIQKIEICYFEPFFYVYKFLNFCSFSHFNDELVQFFFFDRLIVDRRSDLIWHPEANARFLTFDIPKVITVHDLICKELPTKVSYDSEYIFECILKEAQAAKKVITVSNFSKNKICEYMKIPEEKITVIPIEVAPYNFSPSVKTLEDTFLKYGILRQRYFIYISAFWRHKNHLNLLRAFNKFVRETNSDMKLVLVGSHLEIDKSIYYWLAHLGLKDKVIFTNYVPEEEKYILLKNALALIHPSLYEGFGIPIIEAMAAGIPVCCSATASLLEIAIGASLMFNPHSIDEICNAMKSIEKDEALRNRLVRAGKARAESFSNPKRMINTYIQVLQDAF